MIFVDELYKSYGETLPVWVTYNLWSFLEWLLGIIFLGKARLQNGF
jgi:hypothetical protein